MEDDKQLVSITDNDNSTQPKDGKKPFSAKAFFKSNAFKCIYVLLAIVLVCGILLALCNDLFYISPEERLDRVLSKIYPDGKVEEIIYNEDNPTELETEFSSGAIVAAYKMDDGNYLINSYGTGGYGGNVYMWVVFEMDNGSIGGIGNIALDKTDGETFLDRLQPGEYEWFSDNYKDGESFVVSDYTSNTIGTAASASMTRRAITNAVNTALEFVRSQLLGEAPSAPDPFENFAYTDYIDTAATAVELAEDGTSVIFHVVTTGYVMPGAFNIDITVNADSVITDFTITKNGSTDDVYKGYMNEDIISGAMFENKSAADILAMFKQPSGTDGQFVKNDLVDETLASGASESTMDNAGYSNFLCVYAALFASNNYANGYVMALENSVEYTDYIDTAATAVELAEDGTSVIFHVVTTGYVMPGAFNIDITVNADSVITDFTITKNGSTDDVYKGYMNEDIISGAMFENKSAADILAMFKQPSGTDGQFVKNDLVDETLASGASESTMDNAGYSNFLCVYAALFASNNYDVYSKLIPLKLNMQMSEIYGENIEVAAVSLDGLTATVGKGTVDAVYSVSGTDNYIVKATGTEGFSEGTVTCWVIVETDGSAVTGIKKVAIESNVGQSFIDNIKDTTLNHFTEAFNGNDFVVSDWKDNSLTGGASYTTTAIVNSVNSAMNFVKANLLGGAQE